MDNFIAGVLDKAVTADMTDEQKVKAIYDYMIYNFQHDDNAAPFLFGNNQDTPNPLMDAIILSAPVVSTGKGTCDAFANTFRLLALRLGLECNYVSGQYVNRDGSMAWHGWNQVKVNDEWYWVDVDVEGSVFHQENLS